MQMSVKMSAQMLAGHVKDFSVLDSLWQLLRRHGLE